MRTPIISKYELINASNNEVGQLFNVRKAVCREFDLQEIANYIRPYSWSWGYRNAGIACKNKALRFTVSGHHHKGYVYIVLSGMDLFDIYYTTNQGKIKKISKDIYLDMLIETLDVDIERIAAYTQAPQKVVIVKI